MTEGTDKKRAGDDGNAVERERAADRLGDMSGDPQRGGRLPGEDAGTGEEPRPADDSAKSGIPSRSFNL